MKYLVFLSLLSFSALQANIIYVNSNATAGGNGTSWETAYNDLQDALAMTVSGRGDQVWIAQGTYYPIDINNQAEFDRTATFYIKDQVALYGGFIGSETDLAQRDWESYPTILSGEIWEDQAYWSVHVTTIDNNTVTFDGITITKGNANGTGNDTDRAAAVYGGGNVTATNSTFSGNSALYGGVANRSTWTATNSTFSGNSAVGDGGVAFGGTWTATNCTFSGNSAGVFGGVVREGTWTATNCTFSGNSASSIGGVAFGSTWTATNCTFSGNSASNLGGVAYNGTWTATNSTFSGNSAGSGGVAYNGTWKMYNNIFHGNAGNDVFNGVTLYATASTSPSPFEACAYNLIEGGSAAFVGVTNNIPEAYILDADPLFVNIADPDGPDDIWRTEDDGLRLQSSSPAIGRGDASFLPADTYDLDGDDDTVESLPVDIAGYKRIQDTTLDLGAYEYGNVIGLSSVFTTTAGAATGGSVSPSGAIVSTEPTEITLTATANNGYVFGYWSGDVPEELEQENPLTVAVEEDGSITAVFLQDSSDSDGDGLSLYQEVIVYGTDPADADSDDDGFDDGYEVETGYSPLSISSTPDAISGIETAVKYWFYAANGVNYRIEYSMDLENWFILENDIIGAGGEIIRYYDTVGTQKRFYRAKRNLYATPSVLVFNHPSYGEILTDQSGNVLYGLSFDSVGGDPLYNGSAWPLAPQITDPLPNAGATAALTNGTFSNASGGPWLKINNRPVYTYVSDSEPNQASGHGIGSVWFTIKADGTLNQ
jgi:predicted lipoprotein with Yx(FWY)xxD motif